MALPGGPWGPQSTASTRRASTPWTGEEELSTYTLVVVVVLMMRMYGTWIVVQGFSALDTRASGGGLYRGLGEIAELKVVDI